MSTQLERYKEAWQRQSQTLVESDHLTEDHIMEFLASQSSSITSSYRKSLIFDMCLKALLLLSFLLLAYLLRGNGNLVVLNVALMITSGMMLALQSRFYREVGLLENRGGAIREFLESNISYFSNSFTRAIYLAALSSPLFFLSGAMFYFYFTYGTVRPLDFQDYLVLSAGLTLSFMVAAVAQIVPYRVQIRQLEDCLGDFDEGAVSKATIARRRKQQLVFFVFGTGLLLLGLFVMSRFFLS
jgi:hypothetical protein